MPRSPRIDLPGLPQHVIVRGNDRMPIFRNDADRQRFLRYLVEAGEKNNCAIHAFVLMRYIELNPVRASMVGHPREYAWSSYSENAGGRPSGFLRPHPEYVRLGQDAEARGRAYRALIELGISEDELVAIRERARRNLPLGGEMFLDGVEATTGRAARPRAVG